MSEPAWIVINDLFKQNGLAPPPGRLRDQLVMHLIGYRRHWANAPEGVAIKSAADGEVSKAAQPLQTTEPKSVSPTDCQTSGGEA